MKVASFGGGVARFYQRRRRPAASLDRKFVTQLIYYSTKSPLEASYWWCGWPEERESVAVGWGMGGGESGLGLIS